MLFVFWASTVFLAGAHVDPDVLPEAGKKKEDKAPVAATKGYRKLDLPARFERAECSADGKHVNVLTANREAKRFNLAKGKIEDMPWAKKVVERLDDKFRIDKAAPGFRYIYEREKPDPKLRGVIRFSERVRIVDLASDKVATEFSISPHSVFEEEVPLGFSADGRFFKLTKREGLSLDRDKPRKYYHVTVHDFAADKETTLPLREEDFHVLRRSPPTVSPNGKFLASLDPQKGALLLYDVEKRKTRSIPNVAPVRFEGEGEDKYAATTRFPIEFTSDGKKLLLGHYSAGGDTTDVSVLDLTTGRVAPSYFHGKPADQRVTRFSKDGSLVAAVGAKGEMIFRETISGGEVFSHNARVDIRDISFCPNGRNFVTYGLDGVHYWDMQELLGKGEGEPKFADVWKDLDGSAVDAYRARLAVGKSEALKKALKEELKKKTKDAYTDPEVKAKLAKFIPKTIDDDFETRKAAIAELKQLIAGVNERQLSTILETFAAQKRTDLELYRRLEALEEEGRVGFGVPPSQRRRRRAEAILASLPS